MTLQEKTEIGGPYYQRTLRQNAQAIDAGLSQPGTLGNILREHPGPSLLIGAGLVWMLISREQSKSRSLPVRIRDRAVRGKEHLLDNASGAKEHVLEVASDARDHLRDAKDHALESLEEAKHHAGERVEAVRKQASHAYEEAKVSVGERAEQAREAYNGVLEENPLVIGACAVAAGVAFGLLLPSTRREDEMMGSARDSLVDQVKHVADDARQTAVQTLRAGTGDIKTHLTEVASEAKQTVVDSIQNAKKAVESDMESAQPSTGMTDGGTVKVKKQGAFPAKSL